MTRNLWRFIMKNSIFRRVIAMCLLICMLALAVACNNTKEPIDDNTPGTEENGANTDDTKATYKVTVVDQTNAPLKGAIVELYEGSTCKTLALTKANGVVSFADTDRANYTVKVTLNGYTGETSYSFAANSTELTVQLTKNQNQSSTKTTYTVTLVDTNNQPIVGTNVQLCVGEICRLPVTTDASGVATFELDADDYTVKIPNLEGYIIEPYYYFPTNSTELTIQLTPIN